MISLDDFGKDFIALAQAGCSIKIDPVDSMFGVLSVRVIVTPPKTDDPPRTVSEEIPAVLAGAVPRFPTIGTISLFDPGNLRDFFKNSRYLLVPQIPRG